TGGTADRNRSHWSTSKTPSYTKSVSWQHHPNGYGEHSPGGYSMLSALVVELVLSAGFLLVIHGATDKFAPAGFAPIAIGLALTLIHLISIPVTNTSVNPARSTAVAIFQGGWALEQLWFFWVVPIVGGIIGGLIYRTLLEKRN
ncbi:aquaporin, partial [Escherichia coli]|uniref:aquaporin n=3 Tax=Enterobacteriaceae TaxID=543 RepID=UPI002F961745